MQSSSRILTEQTAITTSGTSQQSAAFGSQTRQVRVAAIGNAVYVTFGTNPTATANSTLIPVNWVDYFTVTPGEKLAVLQNTGAGTLNVTEVG